MILLKLLGVAFVSFLGVIPNRVTKIDTKETSIKQTLPKRKKITLDSDYLADKETTYLFVAKNYANNGNGTFYNGSISKETSYHYNGSLSGQTWQALNSSNLDFYLLNGTDLNFSQLSFTFGTYTDSDTSQTIYYLANNYIWVNATNQMYYIYGVGTQSFDRSYCSFLGKNFSSYTSLAITIINTFYDVYIFEESTFTFNSNFNYNAPYGFMTSSTFVNQTATTYNIDLPWFYCNGLAFNRIALVYVDGISTRYIDQNGDLQINTTSGTSYYSLMQYVNTATNYSVMVNSRNFSTYTDSDGYIQTYLNNGSQWINDSYRTITFSDTLTPTQIDGLTVFNTNLNTGYIDNTTGVVSDIGLGSIFALIGSAFGAVSGFLAIQIMPGLTLGLLLFTPLIVGIILAIVWLVKR